MYLKIDGNVVLAKPGQRILDLVRQLGLEGASLQERPLAAKIAGEVFTLNYIPLREKDVQTEHPFIRRAMAASGGEIRLLRYRDPLGKECYIRTAQFVVFLAIRRLWPRARAKMNCTLGDSVYFQVLGAEDFSAARLKAEISGLVQQDIPLIRRSRLNRCI